jgi:hypothetical protein
MPKERTSDVTSEVDAAVSATAGAPEAFAMPGPERNCPDAGPGPGRRGRDAGAADVFLCRRGNPPQADFLDTVTVRVAVRSDKRDSPCLPRRESGDGLTRACFCK